MYLTDCKGLVKPSGADPIAATLNHGDTVTFVCTAASHDVDSSSAKPIRTCNDGSLRPTLEDVPYKCNASKN